MVTTATEQDRDPQFTPDQQMARRSVILWM